MFEHFGMQGPMTNPVQMQDAQSMIHPMLIEKIKSFITPMNGNGPEMMTTPMSHHEPSIMSRFHNEEVNDRYFGGIIQDGEDMGFPTNDLGNYVISQEYGLERLFDLARMLNDLKGQ